MMQIASVAIPADRRPVVDFTLQDADGVPLELEDLDADPRFTLAFVNEDLESGNRSYRSYIVREVEGADFVLDGVEQPPALASAPQAGADSGGNFTRIAPGRFRYRFATELPADFDPTATHTLGAYFSREDRAVVENVIHDFVPAGGEPMPARDIAPTESCNACHSSLGAHGGLRKEVGLCVLCHTDQTVDPETGERLAMSEMVHAIHNGSNLERRYVVVGFRQRVHDYSDVVFPQDVRNCTTCHSGAVNAESWRENPHRVACVGCHDDVDFETGANHAGGLPQDTDRFCSSCHRAQMAQEFDRSVPGAHVVPYRSDANPRLRLEITDVENMRPGATPAVTFTITDENGPVDITSLNRVAIVFGGPTADYRQLISRDHRFTIQGGGSIGTLTVEEVGTYTFSPNGYTLPAGASGTWAAGMEARTQSIPAGPENISFGANNPVAYVDVSAGELGAGDAEPRRQVVTEEECNACHFDLLFHGNLRTDTEYCVLCHNPWATDEARRPDLDPVVNPPESIDFKLMVHRIHRGEELANPYTVFGFGGQPHDYTEVVFPGDLTECETCHLPGTYQLPSPPGASPTVVNIAGDPVPGDEAILSPATAACTGCHDSEDALVHALLNSIVDGPENVRQACATCHGPGRDLSVTNVHSDDPAGG